MYLILVLLFICTGLDGGNSDLGELGIFHCEAGPDDGETRGFIGRNEGDVLGRAGSNGKIHQVEAQRFGVSGENNLEAFGTDACTLFEWQHRWKGNIPFPDVPVLGVRNADAEYAGPFRTENQGEVLNSWNSGITYNFKCNIL